MRNHLLISTLEVLCCYKRNPAKMSSETCKRKNADGKTSRRQAKPCWAFLCSFLRRLWPGSRSIPDYWKRMDVGFILGNDLETALAAWNRMRNDARRLTLGRRWRISCSISSVQRRPAAVSSQWSVNEGKHSVQWAAAGQRL